MVPPVLLRLVPLALADALAAAAAAAAEGVTRADACARSLGDAALLVLRIPPDPTPGGVDTEPGADEAGSDCGAESDGVLLALIRTGGGINVPRPVVGLAADGGSEGGALLFPPFPPDKGMITRVGGDSVTSTGRMGFRVII